MPVNDESRRVRPAVSIGIDQTDTAHLLRPLGLADDMARFGIAECGFPADHMTLVPDLSWLEVTPARRCPHCGTAESPVA